jgi:DNA-binding IclR family transcriptional regulator
VIRRVARYGPARAGQRLLLAYAPVAVVERVLDGSRHQLTERTPPPEALLRELPQIRRTGSLITRGEMSEGAVAVAVPVSAGGEVVCSLTVAGPESRCEDAWLTTTRATLTAAGRRLGSAVERGSLGA